MANLIDLLKPLTGTDNIIEGDYFELNKLADNQEVQPFLVHFVWQQEGSIDVNAMTGNIRNVPVLFVRFLTRFDDSANKERLSTDAIEDRSLVDSMIDKALAFVKRLYNSDIVSPDTKYKYYSVRKFGNTNLCGCELRFEAKPQDPSIKCIV